MELYSQIIQVDFISVVTIVYLIIFMASNDAYDHEINSLFSFSITLLLCLTVSDNLDYFFSHQPTPSPMHKYVLMLGYVLRVMLLMSAVFILQHNSLDRRARVLLWLPVTADALVVLSQLFGDTLFTIDENNEIHKYLLSYVPHAASFVYFIIVLVIAVKRHRKGSRQEALILYTTLAAVMSAVVSEILLKTRGILISAISLMLAFYYLYLHMEHFKRDTLTGALNRMSFFADIKKFRPESITALCELDMNDLKLINDVQGHAAGDKAIRTIADTVMRCLPAGSYVYRLGGDEFAVLFRNIGRDKVQAVVSEIRAELAKTPYVCAVGVAYWEGSGSFSEIYNLADSEMYEDKRKLKEAG